MLMTSIDKARNALKNGSIIIYPTDTVWGIGCDPFNQESVDNLFRIKGKKEEGLSVLINPEKLLTERLKYTNREAAEYVAVASYRNYLEYMKTGDTKLHLIDFPLFEDIINNNRLLHMENGTIHFKFEEAPNNEKTNGY